MIACGTKKGNILIYQIPTGHLLHETDAAHYLAITDLDVSENSDLIITGGKDSKVSIWKVDSLLSREPSWSFM